MGIDYEAVAEAARRSAYESLPAEVRTAFSVYREWRRRRQPYSRRVIADLGPVEFKDHALGRAFAPVAAMLHYRGWHDRVGEFVAVQFEAMDHLGRPGVVAASSLSRPISAKRFERFLARSYVQKAQQAGVGYRPTERVLWEANIRSVCGLVTLHVKAHGENANPEFLLVNLYRLVKPMTAAAIDWAMPGYLEKLHGLGPESSAIAWEAEKLQRRAEVDESCAEVLHLGTDLFLRAVGAIE